MSQADDPLAERLRNKADNQPGQHNYIDWDAAAAEARAYFREILGRERVEEMVKRCLTTACPHGKKKTGPCRMCLVHRLTLALVAALAQEEGT